MIFSSQKSLVAIDIGSATIKLAQLKKGRKGYELQNFGMISLPPDTVIDGEIENAQALTDALRNLLKSEKIKNKDAVIGVSGQSVIIKKISVPLMSEDELAEMIREEAEQYIPFDIDEVNVDFQIVKAEGEIPKEKGTPVPEGKQMDVLIVAVRKEVIQAFVDVFKEVGMRVRVVDLSVFALENIYEMNYEVETDTAIALVNIGGSMTNVNILEGGVTGFTRDISIGGSTISEHIQKSLSIGFNDAEKIKLGQIPKDHAIAEVITHVKDGITQICDELRKTFEMFEKSSDVKVTKVYLCGGSCQLEGIASLVRGGTGIDTEILNSFNRVQFNDKLFDAEYIETMSPVAAIPMGLAMRMAGDK